MAADWIKQLGLKTAQVRMLRPLYDAQMGWDAPPVRIAVSFPADLFDRDAGHGRWVASGSLCVRGQRAPIDTDSWFFNQDEGFETPFFTHCHAFEWLHDLQALGGDTGRKTARSLTGAWLDSFERYHAAIWSPALASARLINWIAAYPFCYETAPDAFLDRLHTAMNRHYRHIAASVRSGLNLDLEDRFTCLCALYCAAMGAPALTCGPETGADWLHLLKGAAEDISHSDGGLSVPALDRWLDVLQRLLIVKIVAAQGGQTPPTWLGKRIDTLAGVLCGLMHTDRNLPCFQGACETRKGAAERLSKLAGARLRRRDSCLVHSGYSSLRKGRAAVIMHHGKGPYAAPAAFEFSHNGERIIVNCGPHDAHAQWRASLAGVNAHSTLALPGSEPHQRGPDAKGASLETMDGAALWCWTHEGWRADHALSHTRRIYLDQSGEDLRGEDVLVRSIALKPIHPVIRFHLHPAVRASLVRGGAGVLIRLPSGTGWMMETSESTGVAVEPSVYAGADGLSVRPTVQITLSPVMADLSLTVKWALKRI